MQFMQFVFFKVHFGAGVLGLFIAMALMAEAGKRKANLWLGIFLFAECWMSFNVFYFDYPEYLFGVFDWPISCLGPALYCYVRELTGIGNDRRQAWHFLPLGVFVAGLCVARLVAPPTQLMLWWQSPLYQNIAVGFQFVLLGYVIALAFMLRKHRRLVRANYSSIKGRDLKWISTLLWAVTAMLAMWIPAFALHLEGLCVALAIAHFVVLNLLGWYALRHIGIFLPQHDEVALPALSAPVEAAVLPVEAVVAPVEAVTAAGKTTMPGASEAAASEKYVRSGMNDLSQQLIGERLARRMHQERDFLENDLTLAELAERIGTSHQLLSQYINHRLGLSFFGYINGLRVDEVKRLIGDPDHADAALLDLAFQAGFNSKSTFNTAFKKITAMTPSVWRKLHVAVAEPVS